MKASYMFFTWFKVNFKAENLEEDAENKGLPSSIKSLIRNVTADKSQGMLCRGSNAMMQNLIELYFLRAVEEKLPGLKEYVLQQIDVLGSASTTALATRACSGSQRT